MVLVIEDEAALVTLLRYNLEREGFAVTEARDGEEALLLAREHKPDLVLLDWMLPHVSGIEVCRQLRRLPDTRSVPIIMLTARGEDSDKVRGLDRRGADDSTEPLPQSERVAAPQADRHADGARRGCRQGARAGQRRRRLHDQALQPERARRAAARPSSPRATGIHRRAARL